MSTTGEMENASLTVLHCPQCREENSSQWKYCAKCGAMLWEPCFRCGEPCAVGENFCGACGASQSDVYTEQVRQIEADFHAAAELTAASRFEEAVALLTRIAKNEHPRLAEHAARAKEQIGRCIAERQKQRVAAHQASLEAQQRFAAFDYDGAAELINKVPPPLQNDEMRRMHDRIAERRREIDALTVELRDAVRQKKLGDLPPRIERLLALKPDHALAKSVASQVQARLIAGAKKMLAGHRYDQALRLLNQISAWVDAPDFQSLHRQAAELTCLAWDLRNAPVIDNTLLNVAKRLRRLTPDDAQNIRLCDELERRIRHSNAADRLEPLPWAKPPEQTPLGVPVEWFAGFRRVTCADALDRADLIRHPGRFAVACGLALAGFKQGELRINLLPKNQQGVLRRVTRLVRSYNTHSTWGLDLGTSGLKAIQLAWDDSKQQAVVEAAALIEHSKPLSHAANPIEENNVVKETLKTFLEKYPLKTDRVCVGLPGRMVLVRQIAVPPVDSAKTEKMIPFEAAQQFPIPLAQLDWDYQILDNLPHDSNANPESPRPKGRHAILMAAKNAMTKHLLDPFKELDIPVDFLQADFVALHNFLIYDYFATSGNAPSNEVPFAVAAADVGYIDTNFIISAPNHLWFRRCGVAGQSFTRALVREFNLPLAEAERRKCAPETAEHLSSLYEVFSPAADDLLRELQQSMAAYAKTQPNVPIRRLFGFGGGFSLHGLFRQLRSGH